MWLRPVGGDLLKKCGDPDEDEDSYLKAVQPLATKLADIQGRLLGDLPLYSSWGEAGACLGDADVAQLRTDATWIKNACMYHVCYYGALTVYRNSQKDSAAMSSREQMQKLSSILVTLASLPAPNWGQRLLGEMKAAVVPRPWPRQVHRIAQAPAFGSPAACESCAAAAVGWQGKGRLGRVVRRDQHTHFRRRRPATQTALCPGVASASAASKMRWVAGGDIAAPRGSRPRFRQGKECAASPVPTATDTCNCCGTAAIVPETDGVKDPRQRPVDKSIAWVQAIESPHALFRRSPCPVCCLVSVGVVGWGDMGWAHVQCCVKQCAVR